MLYELLVGELPFPSAMLRQCGQLEAIRILAEQEPDRPSARLARSGAAAAVATERRTTVGALQRALQGDLDWIVLKALAKEPEHRYDAATALADDLERYLDHRPVLAGPPGAGYRLRKFVRRHRVQVGAAAAVLLALLVGAVGTLVQYLRAERKAAEFDQLAAVVQLDRMLAAERHLQPAWPHQIAAMERWLQHDTPRLLALRPQVEQTVRDLRGRARPGGAGDVAPLESVAEQFLFAELCALLDRLAAFAAEQVPAVERRLWWARNVDGWTRSHPRARATWQQARAAIARADGVTASTLYAGSPIDLQPQTGLVPIGMNPVTKLWEFYWLRSAWDPEGGIDPADLPIPEHRADGSIAISAAVGGVFVLLPGGAFAVGAQQGRADAPRHDADAEPDEAPLQQVTLAPFLLARHELTQGQWRRLSGGGMPSRYRAGDNYGGTTITLAHPVEFVDWNECVELLRQDGLALPTEAQWEYACRAGTSQRWWTGADAATLRGAANLFDRAGARYEPSAWGDQHEDFDDGFPVHAPVGSFAGNGFGLYDMHGNVWERCRDEYAGTSLPLEPGSGLRVAGDGTDYRVIRGGSFTNVAHSARCSHRSGFQGQLEDYGIGLRAARVLQR
jgi:formylglycine-generating enzyme required for sulfatase activity